MKTARGAPCSNHRARVTSFAMEAEGYARQDRGIVEPDFRYWTSISAIFIVQGDVRASRITAALAEMRMGQSYPLFAPPRLAVLFGRHVPQVPSPAQRRQATRWWKLRFSLPRVYGRGVETSLSIWSHSTGSPVAMASEVPASGSLGSSPASHSPLVLWEREGESYAWHALCALDMGALRTIVPGEA